MFILLALAITVTLSSDVNADGCCLLTKVIQPKEKLSVADAFTQSKIVGDYIPEPPKDLFVAAYDSVNIMLGTKMSPLRTIGTPFLQYPNATEGELYTVMLLDIDAPSPLEPTNRAFINGLFGNCRGKNLAQGDVIVPYTPAIPNVGTGYHRFTGFIYTQKGKIDPNNPTLIGLSRDPTGFSAVKFAEEFDLDGPVAGNFFLSQFSVCGKFN